VLVVAGVLVILVAVCAVVRRVDVRLVLVLAGFTLGLLAWKVDAVTQAFLATLSREQFILPICCAMGFAHVLRHTGCDRHLVHLLVKPVRRVRWLLIPGTVLIGFAVNVPIISQASTAVTVGPVLLPLLATAGLSPTTMGAALLLGASIGGDLFNPGAAEFQTIKDKLDVASESCLASVRPLLLVHLAVTTAVFWWLSARAERQCARKKGEQEGEAASEQGDPDRLPLSSSAAIEKSSEPFRVNLFKSLVPLVPLVLLLLTGPPLKWVAIPQEWLVGPKEATRADSRLIAVAMLIGTAVAALSSPRLAGGTAKAFFEGAGYAFTHIISVIVCAQAFGAGVKAIGIAELMESLLGVAPMLLAPLAVGLPLLFALLCGSGYATMQSLYEHFIAPARRVGADPVEVGGLVAMGSAAGRTMSPVAPVALLCASLSGVSSLAVTRRVAVPLLVGLIAMLLFRMVMG
jgi:DcuC family C4-dicarboxylate transporter